jgi:hypothetical protein
MVPLACCKESISSIIDKIEDVTVSGYSMLD